MNLNINDPADAPAAPVTFASPLTYPLNVHGETEFAVAFLLSPRAGATVVAFPAAAGFCVPVMSNSTSVSSACVPEPSIVSVGMLMYTRNDRVSFTVGAQWYSTSATASSTSTGPTLKLASALPCTVGPGSTPQGSFRSTAPFIFSSPFGDSYCISPLNKALSTMRPFASASVCALSVTATFPAKLSFKNASSSALSPPPNLTPPEPTSAIFQFNCFSGSFVAFASFASGAGGAAAASARSALPSDVAPVTFGSTASKFASSCGFAVSWASSTSPTDFKSASFFFFDWT